MKKFSKGVKKYIRKEKASIRSEFLDFETREEKINEVMQELGKIYHNNNDDEPTSANIEGETDKLQQI